MNDPRVQAMFKRSRHNNLSIFKISQGEIRNENQYKMLLTNFIPNKKELPSKILEQRTFKTRPKIEKHMLIVMDKSTHEEHLSQPLLTKNKQFKITVTFLTGYNGIFNVTNKNIRFYFIKSNTDDDFIHLTIPPGAFEIESLNIEIRRIIIDEKHFTKDTYPFTIKSKFLNLRSIIEISTQGPIIRFLPDDCIGDLLGFNGTTLFEQ